jgi:hypothetical protein
MMKPLLECIFCDVEEKLIGGATLVEATDLTALIKPASDQQFCFSVA